MSVRQVTSPSLSTGSYEFVEREGLRSGATTDEDSDDDGNDIVLSPRTPRNSHISTQSLDDLSDNFDVNIEDRDFVLVLPGSSVLSTSSSVTSPVMLSRRESTILYDNGGDDHETTTTNDDARYTLAEELDGLSIHSVHSERPQDTPMPATPVPPSPPSVTLSEIGAQLEEAQRFPRHVSAAPAGAATKPQPSAKALRQRARRRLRAKLKAAALANATNKPSSPSQTTKPKKKKSNKDNLTVSEAGKGGEVKRRKPKAQKQKETQTTKLPPLPSFPLDEESHELYEEAVKYMDQLISSPPTEWTTDMRLATAQSLLVELGVTPTVDSVPNTVSVARRLLASSVHLNILDYLALRHRGIVALRNAMHDSKKALRTDIRKRKAALREVKALGLRDLLTHF